VLTDAELADVGAAVEAMTYPWGPFYRIAILILQRHEEVAAMRWSEIAPDLSVWTMLGARTKNGKLHDVDLSQAAQALLRALSEAQSKDKDDPYSQGCKREACDFVFSTRGKTSISGFSRAKAALDAAITKARAKAAATGGVEPTPLVPWRLHDLQRTGASTLARPGFDTIAIDKLLAHQPALGFRQGAGACPRRVGRARAGLRQRMAQATVRRHDLVSVVEWLADSLGILARNDDLQAIWEIAGSSRNRICTLRRCRTPRSHATSGRTMRSAGVLICLRCRYSERLSADSRGDIGRFGFW
jgi:Phage integrase family